MANQVCPDVFYLERELTSSLDFLKGSYYANPLVDSPLVNAEDKKSYPGKTDTAFQIKCWMLTRV